ncbi:MAG TPA: hypothetical protein VEJ87_14175 [Acidimicrobiales bacterium]|nr:hypothetical protein [Acidimicrobiales bacterium]
MECPRTTTGAVANQTLRRSPDEILAAKLEETQFSVTEFLEDLVKERVFADVISQVSTREKPNSYFAGSPPDVVFVRREALLRGRRSRLAYVYARTLYLAAALPPSARNDLQETDDPIGAVIVRHGLRVERERVCVEPPLLPFDWDNETSIYARRYGVKIAGKPAMQISEWFLSNLVVFLSADSVDQVGSEASDFKIDRTAP